MLSVGTGLGGVSFSCSKDDFDEGGSGAVPLAVVNPKHKIEECGNWHCVSGGYCAFSA